MQYQATGTAMSKKREKESELLKMKKKEDTRRKLLLNLEQRRITSINTHKTRIDWTQKKWEHVPTRNLSADTGRIPIDPVSVAKDLLYHPLPPKAGVTKRLPSYTFYKQPGRVPLTNEGHLIIEQNSGPAFFRRSKGLLNTAKYKPTVTQQGMLPVNDLEYDVDYNGTILPRVHKVCFNDPTKLPRFDKHEVNRTTAELAYTYEAAEGLDRTLSRPKQCNFSACPPRWVEPKDNNVAIEEDREMRALMKLARQSRGNRGGAATAPPGLRGGGTKGGGTSRQRAQTSYGGLRS